MKILIPERDPSRRWHTGKSREATKAEDARASAFLRDIEAVCRLHGLAISHEDSHGSFIIEPLEGSWSSLESASLDF
jgi:hypothetical protein